MSPGEAKRRLHCGFNDLEATRRGVQECSVLLSALFHLIEALEVMYLMESLRLQFF